MIREWATKERLEEIESRLTPPADWRDPFTGRPAGWDDDETDDEAEFWRQWEAQRR